MRIDIPHHKPCVHRAALDRRPTYPDIAAQAMWARLVDRWQAFNTDPSPENLRRLFSGMGALASVLPCPRAGWGR